MFIVKRAEQAASWTAAHTFDLFESNSQLLVAYSGLR